MRPWSAVLLALAILAASAVDAVAEVKVIKVRESEFSPSTLEIRKGDVVRWEWESGVHRLLSGVGPDDEESGILFEVLVNKDNPSFDWTPTALGIFPYYAAEAPATMKATVVVLTATSPVDKVTWGYLKSLFERPTR
jgi:plastocyanin